MSDKEAGRIKSKDIRFVVDNDGCVGVIIDGRFFVDYKGEALEYAFGSVVFRDIGEYETISYHGGAYGPTAQEFVWSKKGIVTREQAMQQDARG